MRTCLLNFQAQFAQLVKSGRKPHTIRARRVDGRDPLPGDMLHLYTGLRSKAARLLRQEICAYTTEITILPSIGQEPQILLGGEPIAGRAVEALAQDDGFENAAAFVQFFKEVYGLPFTGLLIGWRPTPEPKATRH